MRLDPYFELIPVIDLKDACVVSARAGLRQEYQAIHLHSKIVAESSIDGVIEAFMQLYPFKSIYIADLNAICKTGNHQELISRVLREYPECEFWIDDGNQQGLYSYSNPNYKSVYGTEVQESEIKTMNPSDILSLDFMQGHFLGHESWLKNHQSWSNRLMIMNLDHVGGKQGPDINKLTEYARLYPEKQIYAAGGVRNNDDLVTLKNIGVSGVLLSSALHQGQIDFNKQ